MAETFGSISILHVDDNTSFATMAATFLEREDERFAIDHVASASEGLARLDAGSFDCVVSDYEMPEMDGIAFLETVRERYPDLPFVLFTGKGSEAVASDAISAGVTDYMQKEVGSDQYAVLANRIANSVAQYRTERTKARLEEVTERTTDCLWMFGGDWEELLFVSGYEEVWGRSAEALRADPTDFLDGVHPEDREIVRRAIERLSAGEAVDVEYRIRRGEEMRWVWAKRTPIFEDGAVAQVAGFTRDITERKDHERALVQYRTIVEAVSEAAYRIDADGRFTFVSDTLESLSGYDRSELLGEHASLVLDEEDVATARGLIRDLLESDERTRASFELDIVTRDGERIPCEEDMALVRADGEFAGTAGVVRDITERKERERQVRRLHEATRELLTASTGEEIAAITARAADTVLDYPNTVVRLVDEEAGTLDPVAVTDAARETLGPRPVYAVGEGAVGEVYERGEPMVFDDGRDRDGVDGGAGRASMYLPLGEYGTVSVAATEVGVFDQADVDLAQILTSTTVAALQRVERERQLERRNDQLEQFTALVSHDLRNPLNVAQGRVELARESREGDDDHLDGALDALGRSQALVDDLLTLARRGERAADLEPVALGAVVEEGWQHVVTADARLVVDTERTAMAERARLQALVENLVRNAVEHGGSDVTVTVGDCEGGFYVEDDGPGIPEAERERVFETGYSTARNGTGLGLKIVHRIAEAHDWECTLTESATGGARLEFRDVQFVPR